MATDQDSQDWQEYQDWLEYQKSLQNQSVPKQSESTTSTEANGDFAYQLAGGHGNVLQNIGQWGSDLWDATRTIPNAAIGALTAPPSPSTYDNPMQYDPTRFDNPTDTPNLINKAKESGDSLLSFGAGALPGGSTAYDVAKQQLGFIPKRTGAENGEMLRKDLANPFNLVMGASALKEGVGATRGAITGIRDAAFGKPRAVRMGEKSLNDEIYGNILNVGQGVSAEERALIPAAGKYSKEFTEINPVQGLDPSKGRIAFQQFQKNLEDAAVRGVKTRESILEEASKIEAAKIAEAGNEGIKVGVNFEDLPTQVRSPDGTTWGLDKIALNEPGADVGVEMATEFMKKEFGVQQSTLAGADMGMTPSRTLTSTELNTVRKRVDNQIRTMGGWDNQTLNNVMPGLNPSTKDAYVSAMQFYREQLDNALKNHLSDLMGDEAASAFTKAGREYSASKTYGELATRFRNETGQSFTPGSGKRVGPDQGIVAKGPRGFIKDTVDTLLPGRARAVSETEALAREGNAIRQLQELVSLKSGDRYTPIPRGWAQIKTSAENFNRVGGLAVQLGLVSDASQLMTMPDDQAQQVLGVIASAAAQEFETTPDNVNVIDGVYMDPMGRDSIVKKALDMNPAERAKVIGASFRNKYVMPVPVNGPTQQQKPLPPLSALTQSLDVAPQVQDYSFGHETDDMISQLEKMTALHGVQ